MTMRRVSSNCEYIKWSEVEKGTVIRCFLIESKPSTLYPETLIHYVETPEGNRYGLPGKANLDSALEQIRNGWYLEITYLGKDVMKTGKRKGQSAHQFDVACDEERIHPLFSGESSAREDVTYKNSAESPQPTLSAPESSQPQQAPAPNSPPALAAPAQTAPPATQAPAPVAAGVGSSEAATPKRSIF